MKKYLMAFDSGTTSARCILFRKDGSIASMAQREFPQIFPEEGFVEHDPMEIWSTQIAVAAEALFKIGAAWEEIYGLGITNQRETTVVWDRKTGLPVCNAIVWQCRRTAKRCEELRRDGLAEKIHEKTGLLPDPYFSATKIEWILDHVPGARERAERGELCFGTVDSWLIFKLTGGKVHATDVSNASRTMLFNLHTLAWDDELTALFRVPRAMLPDVLPSSAIFGYTDENILGAKLPIAGVAGDQQAALFGQCCFDAGEMKNTYGTGGFLLMNTGETPCLTDNGLVTTVAWGLDGKTYYALEGSVFVSGAAIQWLRDGLSVISSAAESEEAARAVPSSGGVLVVPAFSGLGAPYWDPYARGIILGITRATTKNHIIRATLESLAYQTADVIGLMEESAGRKIGALHVDGGASRSDLLLGFQADILGIDICRPRDIETTALGAAYLAGLALGVYASEDDLRKLRCTERRFSPEKDDAWRTKKMRVWRRAVERALLWAKPEEDGE